MRSAIFTAISLSVFGLANAAPSPADFPRVAQAQQESRDSERRRILEDELKAEQERLAEAASKKDAGAMARHSADIQALSKELGVAVRIVPVTATVKTVSEEAVNAFGSETPEAFGSAN